MIEFFLMNLTVGLTAFLSIKYLFNFHNFIDNILAIFTLFCAQVILTELLLGIANKLYLNPIILFNVIILFFLILIIKLTKVNKSNNFVRGKDQVIDISSFLSNRIILFCTSIIGGFLIVKFFVNLINPPFGWDSLNYHFTFPVEWIKHGNLDTPITINDDPTPTYYPINNNLIYLWLIFPFKSAFLADIGQTPFFIMAFFACYSIARKLNLNREAAFMAASLFSITPNYFKQIEVGYADIMMAALFLISLIFLILLNEDFNFKNLFFVSISLGVFLGIKTVCIPYTAILFIFFLHIIFKDRKKAKLNMELSLFFSIILIIVFGGFGYIRNIILTGNPLYPLQFELFGKILFRGIMPVSTYKSHWMYPDFNLYKLFFREGMGAQFVLLFFPAMILSLPTLILIRKRQNLNFQLTFLLILPLLLYLTFRYLIPQLWTRFLYPFLGISAIVAFYLLNQFNVPQKVIGIIVVICFIGSMAELAGHLELVYSILVCSLLYLLLPLCLRKVSNRKVILSLNLACLILIMIALRVIWKDYEDNEFARYISNSPIWKEETFAWKWLNDNTKGERIAYVGRPIPFPLYGTRFKNDVYHVSVNEKPPIWHIFKNGHLEWGYNFLNMHIKFEEDGNYREKANFNVWYNNLLKENTDYLFVYRLHQLRGLTKFPIEDEWSKAHPKEFKLVFLNKGVHIYKLTHSATPTYHRGRSHLVPSTPS